MVLDKGYTLLTGIRKSSFREYDSLSKTSTGDKPVNERRELFTEDTTKSPANHDRFIKSLSYATEEPMKIESNNVNDKGIKNETKTDKKSKCRTKKRRRNVTMKDIRLICRQYMERKLRPGLNSNVSRKDIYILRNESAAETCLSMPAKHRKSCNKKRRFNDEGFYTDSYATDDSKSDDMFGSHDTLHRLTSDESVDGKEDNATTIDESLPIDTNEIEDATFSKNNVTLISDEDIDEDSVTSNKDITETTSDEKFKISSLPSKEDRVEYLKNKYLNRGNRINRSADQIVINNEENLLLKKVDQTQCTKSNEDQNEQTSFESSFLMPKEYSSKPNERRASFLNGNFAEKYSRRRSWWSELDSLSSYDKTTLSTNGTERDLSSIDFPIIDNNTVNVNGSDESNKEELYHESDKSERFSLSSDFSAREKQESLLFTRRSSFYGLTYDEHDRKIDRDEKDFKRNPIKTANENKSFAEIVRTNSSKTSQDDDIVSHEIRDASKSTHKSLFQDDKNDHSVRIGKSENDEDDNSQIRAIKKHFSFKSERLDYKNNVNQDLDGHKPSDKDQTCSTIHSSKSWYDTSTNSTFLSTNDNEKKDLPFAQKYQSEHKKDLITDENEDKQTEIENRYSKVENRISKWDDRLSTIRDSYRKRKEQILDKKDDNGTKIDQINSSSTMIENKRSSHDKFNGNYESREERFTETDNIAVTNRYTYRKQNSFHTKRDRAIDNDKDRTTNTETKPAEQEDKSASANYEDFLDNKQIDKKTEHDFSFLSHKSRSGSFITTEMTDDKKDCNASSVFLRPRRNSCLDSESSQDSMIETPPPLRPRSKSCFGTGIKTANISSNFRIPVRPRRNSCVDSDISQDNTSTENYSFKYPSDIDPTKNDCISAPSKYLFTTRRNSSPESVISRETTTQSDDASDKSYIKADTIDPKRKESDSKSTPTRIPLRKRRDNCVSTDNTENDNKDTTTKAKYTTRRNSVLDTIAKENKQENSSISKIPLGTRRNSYNDFREINKKETKDVTKETRCNERDKESDLTQTNISFRSRVNRCLDMYNENKDSELRPTLLPRRNSCLDSESSMDSGYFLSQIPFRQRSNSCLDRSDMLYKKTDYELRKIQTHPMQRKQNSDDERDAESTDNEFRGSRIPLRTRKDRENRNSGSMNEKTKSAFTSTGIPYLPRRSSCFDMGADKIESYEKNKNFALNDRFNDDREKDLFKKENDSSDTFPKIMDQVGSPYEEPFSQTFISDDINTTQETIVSSLNDESSSNNGFSQIKHHSNDINTSSETDETSLHDRKSRHKKTLIKNIVNKYKSNNSNELLGKGYTINKCQMERKEVRSPNITEFVREKELLQKQGYLVNKEQSTESDSTRRETSTTSKDLRSTDKLLASAKERLYDYCSTLPDTTSDEEDSGKGYAIYNPSLKKFVSTNRIYTTTR